MLVDTGFGLRDCADPSRIGPTRYVIRPALAPNETAARQIKSMGLRTEDVRHIVVTHFDMDHIGGIADFPDASIHVTADEAYGAMRNPSRAERIRYRSVQWSHGPRIVEHRPAGEAWRGFPAAQSLDEIDPGIVLIPMTGHSRGHAGVAVDAGTHWVLRGRRLLSPRVVDGRSTVPRGLRLQDRITVFDRKRFAGQPQSTRRALRPRRARPAHRVRPRPGDACPGPRQDVTPTARRPRRPHGCAARPRSAWRCSR